MPISQHRRIALDRVCDHTFVPGLFESTPSVIDLGANHGEFTADLVRRYGVKSVAVEPNPALASDVAKSGAVEVIHAAISGHDGPVHLAVGDNDQESTIHAADSRGDLDTHEVRGLALTSLLDKVDFEHIDLLKVDIEGMEIEALVGLRDDQLDRIDQITVEFHDSQGLTDKADMDRVSTRLDRSGFERIRMSLRHCGDVLYIRRSRLTWAELFRIRWVGRPVGLLQRVMARGTNKIKSSTTSPSSNDQEGGRRFPLKIAIVSYYLPSASKQGGGYLTDTYARALVARGHHVTVISGCPPVEGAPYETAFIDLKGSLRTFRFAIAVAKFDLSGYDVLHANGDDYWCWGRHVPVHVRVMHGSCFDEAIHIHGMKEKIRMVALGCTELVATLVADRTYLVNPAVRRWMPWVHHVAPNGVNLHIFSRPEDIVRSDDPAVLFVGTFRQRKRGALLVEAFTESVLPVLPNARLWMVCEDCPPSAGVEPLGRLSDAELIERYHTAWVFCLPSSFEGFGIPYVEAMAAGLPVLATDNQGSRFVLDDGQAGVICTDDALGQRLLELLQNEGERIRLSAAGNERSKQFDLETMVDTYEDAYYELLARTRSYSAA